MKVHFLNLISLMFVCILLSASVGHTQFDPHVHGHASLMLALEKSVIEMDFNSPAMNLVGFEHKATTQEDIEKVESAKRKLQQHDALYTFVGTQCTIDSVAINTSGILDENQHQHHDAHQEHHAHDAKHDHGNRDTHSEVSAKYRFACKNIHSLKSIKLSLFEYFPGISKVNTMWVTENSQGSVTLGKDKPTIDLK